MALEEKIFTGALDTDTEARLLAPNDYRYALNIRSGSAEDADMGSITNVKGNTLISFDLPAGTNESMGTYEDKKNKRLLYLLYNSNSDHQVLEYDISSNSISLILQSEYINLDPNFPIHHINLIDDKLLHWVDNFGDPHKLNIDRAKKPLNITRGVIGAFGVGISPNIKLAITFGGTLPFSVGTEILLSGFTENSYNVMTVITNIGVTHFETDIDFIAGEGGAGRTARTIDGYPSPFKKQYLDAIVYPSLCPPTAQYKDEESVKINNLRGTLFQFKTQYIYAEAEKSAWSPISKLPLPQGEENFANAQHVPEWANNKIELRLSTGDELVKKINIAGRMGNTGDFFLIDTLEKDKLNIASNSYTTYKFYNDGIYSSIELKESIKLFDRVPRKAATQEFIDGNKLTYGNILEDFDPINIDMNITPIYNDAFVPSPGEQPTVGATEEVGTKTVLNDAGLADNNNTIDVVENIKTPITFPSAIQKGNLYILDFTFTSSNGYITSTLLTGAGKNLDEAITNAIGDFGVDIGAEVNFTSDDFSYTYTAEQGDTINDVVTYFANQINNDSRVVFNYHESEWRYIGGSNHRPAIGGALPKTAMIAYPNGATLDILSPQWNRYLRTNNVFGYADQTAYFDVTINVSANTKAYSTAPIQRAFKRGANHEFGIAYFDFANRSGHVNKSKDTSVYVKFFPETPEKGHADMDVEINHKPPEWATHYQLYYTKNQTTEAFLQGQPTSTITDTIGSNITILKISLTNILITYKEDNPNSILNFVPKAGDRLRIMKHSSGAYYNTMVDLEILSFDSGTSEITIPEPPQGISLDDNEFFEIYSPKKDIKEKFYYEIGECYEIGNAGLSNRYHKGYQNQITGTQPAIIQLRNEGDIYYKQRFIKDSSDAIVGHMIEEFNFSDFYLSAHINIGRVNVHNLNIKEIRRPTTLYHSEIFIPDSNINGLSSIFGDSFKEYDQSNGSIQKLYTENKRLICFQELKVGMILINESVMYDQIGTPSILKSQQILSDIIYYAGEYGIGLDPGSFAVYGKRKYFADVNRGAVLRLSQDGITPISEYKMHNHFTDRFKEIKESGVPGNLLGVYDTKFKEYILSYEIAREVKGYSYSGISGRQIQFVIPLKDVATLQTFFSTRSTIEVCFFDRNTQEDTCYETIIASMGGAPIIVIYMPEDAIIAQGDEITIKLEPEKETIAFNELTKRWVTFYSYFPERMSGLGMGIVTFKDGKLYKHNDNSIYNNFYGVQYESILEFIANEDPRAVKFFLGIEEESNNIWFMPRATNLNGQQTSLIKEDFEDIEGVFWAAFFKDENSNGGLLEGEDMRGPALSIRLKNDETVFQKLFSVGIRSELSQRTNV